jgi:hypothetical protein
MAKNAELVVSGIDEKIIDRIDSFAAAFGVAQETGLSQDQMLFQASSYPLLEDKETLLGVPFIITQVKWGESKKFRNAEGPNRFVILYVVTEGDEKWTLTDGSTGIAQQVEDMVAERVELGITPTDQMFYVKNGLTVSNYEYTDDKGNVSDAHTFYLA